MSNPNRVLIWMIIFLIGVLISTVMLSSALSDAFMTNHVFNGVILGVLFIGILINFRQVLVLHPDVEWLEDFPRSLKDVHKKPRLLSSMAKMLEKRTRGYGMSAMTMRSVLDGIRMRLDESRDVSHYITGLLVFLGLLGTFWGLLDTISGVASVIAELSNGTQDNVGASFQQLMQSIQTPLAGMGTAFSSSLFGLSGAVIIGFLDLQASHAQNRFFNELEDRLADISHVSSSTIGVDTEQSLPGFIEGLLERTAESLEKLQTVMGRNEEDRISQTARQMELNERIADLTDQIRSEHKVMMRIGQSQAELQPAIVQLAEQIGSSWANDEQQRKHMRNLDVGITQLIRETVSGNERMIEELRKEFRLLAHTIVKQQQGKK